MSETQSAENDTPYPRLDALLSERSPWDEPKRERLIEVNWPALWCLVFFAVGFLVGRLW